MNMFIKNNIQNNIASYKNTPVFMIAGEVSGDMFAADLMQHMKKNSPYTFIGLGGSYMKQQGLIPIAHDNSLFSSVGLLEAIRFIFKHISQMLKVVPHIKKYNIKHVILVDHEVFSIIAAKLIRKSLGDSVKLYFYIPPRVSMWGARNAVTVGELADAIFCYMQPDLEIYKKYNKNSFFFGNPLSPKLKKFIPDPQFMKKNNLNPNKCYIALMPGSRKQEIESLLPIFLKTAFRLNTERNIEFLMAVAHKDLLPKIKKEIQAANMEHAVHIICAQDANLNIMHYTSIGIVSAGTITLEAAMMKMYPIITYKVSNYTFQSIKKAENLPDNTLIGLPNVFLQERIFPEILQFEVTPDRLYQEVMYVLDMKPELFEYMMTDIQERLSDTLGSPDSVQHVAEYIMKQIDIDNE